MYSQWAQYICLGLICLGAVVIALCNRSTSQQDDVARGERPENAGGKGGWLSRHGARITFYSAIVVAAAGLGNSYFSSAAHKLETKDLGLRLSNLDKDYSSLQDQIRPIRTFAETSGVSLTQAILELTRRRDSSGVAERNAQAVVGVSDLFRTLRDYDFHFRSKSFDSAVTSLSRSVGLESGQYLKGMIEFAEQSRHARDSKIDSALVRLRILGVNTDTLKVERKLPIRIGQALKSRARALGAVEGELNSILQCDSL